LELREQDYLDLAPKTLAEGLIMLPHCAKRAEKQLLVASTN